MPIRRIDHTGHFEAVKSRLGDSLVRLHRELERTRQEECRCDNSFREWQAQWSKRRDLLSRRLQLIDDQLCKVADGESETPRFSLVGIPADATS